MGFWSWLTGSKGQSQDADNKARSPHVAIGSAREASPVGVALAPGSAEAAVDVEESAAPWWAPEGATLVEPIQPERPELSTEARALENALVSHFDGHDLDMPPLPQVVERTLAHLRKPDCSLRAVADDISEDQVVAAAVLRMTNSPLYRGLNKITALQPAVTRLGTKALQTLMMHESLRAAIFHKMGRYAELAKLVWRCSVASACVMRELSQLTPLDEEDAFLMGLLHDIGDVIVLRIISDQSKFTGYQVDIDTFDYLCAECHQEFGELIADHWKLPETLKVLLADHHQHPAPDDPLRTERLQLQVTDMIVALLGYAPSASYNLMESRAVHDLGLADRQDFRALLDGLPERVEETVSFL